MIQAILCTLARQSLLSRRHQWMLPGSSSSPCVVASERISSSANARCSHTYAHTHAHAMSIADTVASGTPASRLATSSCCRRFSRNAGLGASPTIDARKPLDGKAGSVAASDGSSPDICDNRDGAQHATGPTSHAAHARWLSRTTPCSSTNVLNRCSTVHSSPSIPSRRIRYSCTRTHQLPRTRSLGIEQGVWHNVQPTRHRGF